MFGVTFSASVPRPAVPLVIDTSPTVLDLFRDERLSARTASWLLCQAHVRTIGYAAKLGRRRLRVMDGCGPKTLAEIEATIRACGLEMQP